MANSAIVPVAADGSVSVFVSTSAHIIVDINGYFVEAGGAVSAGRLTSITPLRVFDIRPEERKNYPGPKPSNDSTTTVDLTASASGLPEGATAALVNITTTQTTGGGFVQAAAAGELVPAESSVLNTSGPNQDVAGLSIVPLSAAGEIDLYTLRSAHLIVDLIGWFTSDTDVATTSGLFVPVPPERVRETRRFESLNQPAFGGSGGCCGVSNNALGLSALAGEASAVVLNVTAIGGERPGFIQIGGRDRSFSTVNYPGVGAVANAAVVPFAPSDVCCARPPMVTAFQSPPVDMSGYFTK